MEVVEGCGIWAWDFRGRAAFRQGVLVYIAAGLAAWTASYAEVPWERRGYEEICCSGFERAKDRMMKLVD